MQRLCYLERIAKFGKIVFLSFIECNCFEDLLLRGFFTRVVIESACTKGMFGLIRNEI